MIQNYLKLSWRHLRKHLTVSLINIFGLATGIGACMIIFLYVHSEMTYDRYNVNADRIVRVTTTLHTPESDVDLAISPPPLANILNRNFPEVESTVRLQQADQLIKTNNDVFSEGSFYMADPSAFSVFTFHFLDGSPATALKNPNSIVITEAISRKYFGPGSAFGRSMVCISSSDGHKGHVVGVVKDSNFNTLYHAIEPLVMVYNTSTVNTITVKIKPQNLPVLKAIFKKTLPRFPSNIHSLTN